MKIVVCGGVGGQSTERHVKTLALRACKKARAPVWCAYDWAFVRAGPEEQANLYAIGCPGMSLAEAQDHEAEADRDWMTCLDLAPVALHWYAPNPRPSVAARTRTSTPA